MSEKRERKSYSGAAQAVGGGALALGVPAVSRAEKKVIAHRVKRIDSKIAQAKKDIPSRAARGGSQFGPKERRKGPGSPQPHSYVQAPVKPGKKVYAGGNKGPMSASQREELRLSRKAGFRRVRELEAAKKIASKPKVFPKQSKLWAGAVAAGVPISYMGAQRQVRQNDVSKKMDEKDVTAAYVGGTAAGIGYQGGAMLTKPIDWKNEKKIRNSPRLSRINAAHNAKYRPKNMTTGDTRYREYFRNYPKELPGSKMKRAFAITHTGKTGGAATLGVIGAGAAGAVHHSRKKRVKKSMSSGVSAFGVDHCVEVGSREASNA